MWYVRIIINSNMSTNKNILFDLCVSTYIFSINLLASTSLLFALARWWIKFNIYMHVPVHDCSKHAFSTVLLGTIFNMCVHKAVPCSVNSTVRVRCPQPWGAFFLGPINSTDENMLFRAMRGSNCLGYNYSDHLWSQLAVNLIVYYYIHWRLRTKFHFS